MEKMKLDLDGLAVESFAAEAEPERQSGTVRAHNDYECTQVPCSNDGQCSYRCSQSCIDYPDTPPPDTGPVQTGPNWGATCCFNGFGNVSC